MEEEDLLAAFGTVDLYKILGIERSCNAGVIKKAYHKKSLKFHPDRHPEDKENFTVKFQLLHQIYSLMSDQERRREYDEHGTLAKDTNLPERNTDEWSTYWRELFRKITLDDILEYEKKYKGSDEELEDVRSSYIKYKGDMDMIMQHVYVTYEEEDRIRDIINDLISKKEVRKFTAFSKEDPKKRKKREREAVKEAREAEELKAELGLGGNGEDSLHKAIALRQEQRQKNSESFFAQLEAKYAQPAKKRKVNQSKNKNKNKTKNRTNKKG